MLHCITFYAIENFQKQLAPKFLNIVIVITKADETVTRVYLWTSCSFVENAVARKKSLAFSVLDQTANFGRLICPKPHSLRGN